MWHSLVVRSVRDRKVASSNLVTSTSKQSSACFEQKNADKIGDFFYSLLPSLCLSPKTRQSEMRDARKCSLFRRYAPHKSCHGGKTLPYSRKRFRRFLLLRQVFPYSQKVTQAELFASARFARRIRIN